MITRDNVIDQMLKQIPEFGGIYKEHLEDNYDEVLHHPLFAELARFAIDMYRSSRELPEESRPDDDVFERIVSFVEDAVESTDERVVELVQLSFLENLHQAGSYYEAIRSQLGPGSSQLLEAVEKGWRQLES
jgi:hypothetical protein